MADDAGATTGGDCAANREQTARVQRATGQAGVVRDGENLPGGAGRGTGDDRHLRFCCRPEPNVVWQNDAFGAPEAQNVRTVASAWAGWGDFSV